MSNIVHVDPRLHDIYRMRDLSGRLLYIGVTNGGLRRFMEHAKDKTWWREVAQIDVEHVHCSRSVIESIEREAIRSERPLYNVVHNVDRVELPPPAAVIHVCTQQGDTCPTRRDVVESLRPAGTAFGTDGVRWMASRAGWTKGTAPINGRVTHCVRGATQIAILTLVMQSAEGGLQLADATLLHIMGGGWGAPTTLEGFRQLLMSDYVGILHTYFDQDDVRALGFDGRDLCATLAGVESAAVV